MSLYIRRSTMATEFQYAAVPDKMKEFLEKIRSAGIPDKATYAWLESLGYKSSNDRSIIKVLKFIGFADESGNPSKYWKKYRGANHDQVLAEAIRQGYQELFAVYPNAHQLDDTDLESFFSTKTTSGKQVISRLVRTFRVLCDLADFSSPTPVPPSTPTATARSVLAPSERPVPVLPSTLGQTTASADKIKPQITFNIQVVLPENATSETYDNIFKSIATHLLGRDEAQ
jgi:hypothetical protein